MTMMVMEGNWTYLAIEALDMEIREASKSPSAKRFIDEYLETD